MLSFFSSHKVLYYVSFLPCLILAFLLAWSYTVHVAFLFPQELSHSVVLPVLGLITIHILLILLLVSYFKCVFISPGHPKEKEQEICPSDEPNRSHECSIPIEPLVPQSINPLNGSSSTPSQRFCNKCQVAKPPRCHHCSVCNRCVLKMDHHCPWINNCVGYFNQKFFFLFLLWGAIYCLFSAALGIAIIVRDFQEIMVGGKDAPYQVLLLSFAGSIFGLTLLPFRCEGWFRRIQPYLIWAGKKIGTKSWVALYGFGYFQFRLLIIRKGDGYLFPTHEGYMQTSLSSTDDANSI